MIAASQHVPRPLPLFLSLLRSETAASPERRARALAGLRRYQQADRPPRPPLPEPIATAGRVALRDYGGSGRPVVFVPSLINPPMVLDLRPDNSLIGHLRARGHRVLLVDWGVPTPEDAGCGLLDHVGLLVSLLRAVERPVLAGYCLGGTLALAAAAKAPPAGLVLLAAPWRFDGFAPAALEAIAAAWAEARPACAALGLVPIELLQSMFWRIDPRRTVAKFERVAAMDDAEFAGFVALEDWANAGAPLPFAAGRDLFEDCFAADLPGRGGWNVDPAAFPHPGVEFVSATDRITPAAAAAGLPDRRTLAAGHVGMVVGSRARALLWDPLADWLSALPAPR